VIYAAGAIWCALAPSIGLVIAGRFIQGLGGGLLSALAYVLVRTIFPEGLWPRVFGLFAGVWSVSVPVGPLLGGLFAGYGNWRGAFFAVTGVGFLLGVAALLILPAKAKHDERDPTQVSAPSRSIDLCRHLAAGVGERLDRALDQERFYRRCNRSISSDAADRSPGGPCAPSVRRLLPAIADWGGTVDSVAALGCLQPACDLRAAVPAAIAWAQSAGRGVYGC
jgi:MFS family permease